MENSQREQEMLAYIGAQAIQISRLQGQVQALSAALNQMQVPAGEQQVMFQKINSASESE